jgi:hypothetical protein
MTDESTSETGKPLVSPKLQITITDISNMLETRSTLTAFDDFIFS